MARWSRFILLFAFASAISQPASAAPALTGSSIPNLGTVKAEIRTYYGSGEWLRETSAVVASAEAFVDSRLRQHPARPAVVFDIDDTALSDYGYEASHDFGYDPRSYDADVDAESFPAIQPTLAFARRLRQERVAVFFVTGRRVPERAVTLGNLLKAGYPMPAGLMLRPVSDRARSVIGFKSHARAAIQARGYTVLLSMGDQWSDLRGGHAERDFKLPNPMYFVP